MSWLPAAASSETHAKSSSATREYSPCALAGAAPGSPSIVTVLPEPVWPYAKHVPWPPRVPKRWRTIGRSAWSKICALVALSPKTPSKR